MKVSEYIAEFFEKNGIKTVFTVVGGGAMHLNDSLGHSSKLQCIYNHHEQASAMAAEAYFRVNNEMAAVCVTSGPGAINALNGVAGAYQDSIPMIVLSGQCKSTLTARKNGLDVRCLGPQEFDIVSALDNFTKYAEMVLEPSKIRYCLEKAFYLSKSGRPGPCWLDIPVDIQAAQIDPDKLEGYVIEEPSNQMDISGSVKKVIEHLSVAQRPVIYAGNGVRIAGAQGLLNSVAARYHIPVVTCWDSIDIVETDSEYYAGRGGIMGDRSGNFAVQNSDLVIAIGNRLNIYQVGYNLESWARQAFIVMVDVDENELAKPTIRVDLPICSDAFVFLKELATQLKFTNSISFENWMQQCTGWKKKYPVVSSKQRNQSDLVNVYGFIDKFSRALPENAITVVANGSASVVGSQTYYIGRNQRFIMNCAISSMGYDLPASVGACVANGKNEVYCIAGDGSIQMNIQELQTIVTNRLPIKIVVINNQGYHQIRISQTNLFGAKFVGVGPESHDLGFPEFEKLAWAYGIPYKKCEKMSEINDAINWMTNEETYCLLEVFCDTKQFFEPKSATKKLEDGSLYSPPLEDLAPFLTREELKENMLIDMWNEGK